MLCDNTDCRVVGETNTKEVLMTPEFGNSKVNWCPECVDRDMNMLVDDTQADHPARVKAILIIEKVIEPLMGKGLSGAKYYEAEDNITNIIVENND